MWSTFILRRDDYFRKVTLLDRKGRKGGKEEGREIGRNEERKKAGKKSLSPLKSFCLHLIWKSNAFWRQV